MIRLQQLRNLLRATARRPGPNRASRVRPGEHTVDEVKAYVDEHPDERQAVLDAEAAGKNRVTLVDWLRGASERRARRCARRAGDGVERVEREPGTGSGGDAQVRRATGCTRTCSTTTTPSTRSSSATIRLYKRLGSPEGVAGWSDLGVVRILGSDPDIARLLEHKRDMSERRDRLMPETFIADFRRDVRDLLRAECSVPVYGYLPDDVAHLPVIAVGRPGRTGRAARRRSATMTLDVTLLGRRISDEDSQAELDALADELFDARSAAPAASRSASPSPGCWPAPVSGPARVLVAGLDYPAYLFTVTVDISVC